MSSFLQQLLQIDKDLILLSNVALGIRTTYHGNKHCMEMPILEWLRKLLNAATYCAVLFSSCVFTQGFFSPRFWQSSLEFWRVSQNIREFSLSLKEICPECASHWSSIFCHQNVPSRFYHLFTLKILQTKETVQLKAFRLLHVEYTSRTSAAPRERENDLQEERCASHKTLNLLVRMAEKAKDCRDLRAPTQCANSCWIIQGCDKKGTDLRSQISMIFWPELSQLTFCKRLISHSPHETVLVNYPLFQ